MNPGLFVKLRPTGPWRIGPDSGARNRVDVIYHSDSVFAAVTSAMMRLGCLEEWLEETARATAPAVCFGSCFPFLDEIGFVVPPRNAWPPSAPALLAARVRWKSARFVPLGLVPAILAGQALDELEWAIDGPSECLVPAGRPGPFRMDVRWNAAVDRLTGSAERHSTACLEFRPGAGLWTVVSFADEAARERWAERVKAAFRWLADSGFGGERSRGWGRAEMPEFVEGMLPEMILGAGGRGTAVTAEPARVHQEPERTESLQASVVSAPEVLPLKGEGQEPGPGDGQTAAEQQAEDWSEEEEAGAEETDPEFDRMWEEAEEMFGPPLAGNFSEVPSYRSQATPETEASGPDVLPGPPAGEPEEPSPLPPLEEPPAQPPAPDPEPEPPGPPPEPLPEPLGAEPAGETQSMEAQGPGESAEAATPGAAAEEQGSEDPEAVHEPAARAGTAAAPAAGARRPVPHSTQPHWLLSLFSPAEGDAIDWSRGDYEAVTRGGRVDSPARSGELKKQVRMVAEGSVVYAAGAPRGTAPDVAPDGFPHPVFRSGFALAIPLAGPESGL